MNNENIEPNLETKIPKTTKPMSSLSELTHRLTERHQAKNGGEVIAHDGQSR